MSTPVRIILRREENITADWTGNPYESGPGWVLDGIDDMELDQPGYVMEPLEPDAALAWAASLINNRTPFRVRNYVPVGGDVNTLHLGLDRMVYTAQLTTTDGMIHNLRDIGEHRVVEIRDLLHDEHAVITFQQPQTEIDARNQRRVTHRIPVRHIVTAREEVLREPVIDPEWETVRDAPVGQ